MSRIMSAIPDSAAAIARNTGQGHDSALSHPTLRAVWLPDSTQKRPLVPAYSPAKAFTTPTKAPEPATLNQNRRQELDDPTPRKSRLRTGLAALTASGSSKP